jgi:hypothetical protein
MLIHFDSDTEDGSDPSNDCGFSGIRLRMSNLEAAVSGFDANKGPGITAFLLPFLNSAPIFNLSRSTGTFLSKWKDSFLILLFKTGKRNDVGIYRSMEILSCFAKFFDVTVYDYIFFRSNLLLCLINTGFLRAGQL